MTLPYVFPILGTVLVLGFSFTMIIGWESNTMLLQESIPALLDILHILPLGIVKEIDAIWRCAFAVPTDLLSGLRFALAYIFGGVLFYFAWLLCVAGALVSPARRSKYENVPKRE